MILYLSFKAVDLNFLVGYDKHEVLLLSDKRVLTEEYKIYYIENFTIDRKKYMNDYEGLIRRVTRHESIDQSYKDIFLAHSGNFFNGSLMQLFKWIESINQLSEKFEIKELIISNFVDSQGYIPFYESEGEINKGILYEKYDFIPFLIKQIFESKFKITIAQRHSRLLLWARIIGRRYFLLLAKLIFNLFGKFNERKSEAVINLPNISLLKNIKIFISRGVAHTDFMFNYVKETNNNTILLLGEGLFNFGKNKQKASLLGLDNFAIEKSYITYTEHLKIFIKILGFLRKKNAYKYLISIGGEKNVDISSVITEFIIHHYEVLLHQAAIVNLIEHLKKKAPIAKLALFTGEFYGGYAYLTGLIGKKYKIPTFQLQNFVCDKVDDIGFLNCEYILFHSLSEQLKFSQTYQSLSAYFLYWGNIRYGKILTDIVVKQKQDKLKLIYFSQPIVVEQEQEAILAELLRLKDVLKFDLSIKIHPRESLTHFIKYAENNVSILDGLSIIDSYLPDYDIAIIQTSAIGQQIVLAGIPIIICQISDFTRNITADFIVPQYYGRIESTLALEERIQNYNLLVSTFVAYRKNYIQDKALYKNIDYFNKSYSSFKYD